MLRYWLTCRALLLQMHCGARTAATLTLTTTTISSSLHIAPIDPHTNSTEAAARPAELDIHDTFLCSEIDFDALLLLEAHAKHGVWLNVPPQLPPENSTSPLCPEAVPAVHYCAAQAARLSRTQLAYEPTTKPPPLQTAGTHWLDVRSCEIEKTKTSAAAAAAATSPVGSSNNSKEEAAEAATTTATMRAGPQSDTTPKASKTKAADSTPSSSSTSSLQSTYERATLSIPAEELVHDLLLSVWDSVALARPDIVKLPAVAQWHAEEEKARKAHTNTSNINSNNGNNNNSAETRKDSKPRNLSLDSKNGSWFIPAAFIVEGKADRREEMRAAAAAKAPVRATPIGAAPGIRRNMNNTSSSSSSSAAAAATMAEIYTRGQNNLVSGDATALGKNEIGRIIAPTRLKDGARRIFYGVRLPPCTLTIRERSRRFANPFARAMSGIAAMTPDLSLAEEAEKLPANPFLWPTTTTTNGEKHEKNNKEEEEEDRKDVAQSAEAKSESTNSNVLSARPYVCPLCAAARAAAEPSNNHDSNNNNNAHISNTSELFCFRLLDGLLDHMDDVHAEVGGAEGLTEAQWQVLREVQRRVSPQLELLRASNQLTKKKEEEPEPQVAKGGEEDEKKKRQQGAEEKIREAASPTQSTQAQSVKTDEGSENTTGADTITAASPDVPEAASTASNEDSHTTPATPSSTSTTITPSSSSSSSSSSDAPLLSSSIYPPRESVELHIRAAVNTILVGVVRDVQDGYLNNERVLQYVVGLAQPARELHSRSAHDTTAAQTTTTTNEEEEGEEEEEEEELVLVRCTGGLLPAALLAQQIRIGTQVYVLGRLRMNRHVDALSRRLHAYPYVLVAPPLGCIKAL